MKLGALLLVLVVACTSSNDDRPVGTGGGGLGGGGGGGGGDAGVVTDGGAEAKIVCNSTKKDLVAPTVDCAANGLNGLSVSFAGGTAVTTGPTGAYPLPTNYQDNPGQIWRVSGTGFVTSLVMAVSGEFTLPTITGTDFNALVQTNTAAMNGGSIFVQATTSTGGSAAGLSGSSAPAAEFVFYDDAGVAWDQNAGAKTKAGSVWFSGITASTANVTVTLDATHAVTVSGVPVEAGANTYVHVVMPD